MQYFQNPFDGLWYETHVNINEFGESTLVVSPSGVTASETTPTIPVPGTPLITIEEYMVILGLTIVTQSSQWTFAALGVSDFIERYCNYSWRTEEVVPPDGLKIITAQMIQTQLDLINRKLDPTKKSENLTNYGYTLSDSVKSRIVLEQFQESLNMYKEVAFGWYSCSGE